MRKKFLQGVEAAVLSRNRLDLRVRTRAATPLLASERIVRDSKSRIYCKFAKNWSGSAELSEQKALLYIFAGAFSLQNQGFYFEPFGSCSSE